jgi:protease I
MENRLQDTKIAILATDGFEEVELTQPMEFFKQAGADVKVISPKGGKIKAWKETDWSIEVPVDLELDQARPEDFDALHLPGGVINPDKLRLVPKAVDFVKAFFRDNKPVVSICHGPQLLIEAGAVRGRALTSWPSLKTDLRNAGAEWVDRQVVEDGNLVTSRKPADIPFFNEAAAVLFERSKVAASR